MGFLNANLNEVLSYVKDAYTEVYGIQYRQLIENRINSGKYIFYDKDSINDFYHKCESVFVLENEFLKSYLKSVYDDGDTFITTARNQKGENVGVMFFPIYKELEGEIEWSVLHECGHIIDVNVYQTVGFDFHGYFHYVNPCEYREYERFNEILTDIFAFEAADVLHNSGIYFAEDKEKLVPHNSLINTDRDIRKFVFPLIEDYRDEVIYSKLTGDYSILFDKIGKENFDKLNSIINKAQRLIDDGLFSGNNDLLSDYFKLLDELESVYDKMSDYSLKGSSK